MEALIAIALAGNVIQFCGVAARVISQTEAGRRRGNLDAIPDLKKSGQHAIRLADTIAAHLSGPNQQLSDEDSVRAMDFSPRRVCCTLRKERTSAVLGLPTLAPLPSNHYPATSKCLTAFPICSHLCNRP